MIQAISGIVFLFSLFLVLILSTLDRRRTREPAEQPITFIIPCYNDGHILPEAVESVTNTQYINQLIIIDDASTDDSADVINKLKNTYDFTVIQNQTNQGKAASLNQAVQHADHQLIFFVDADVSVNTNALEDAVARLQDPSVGGVSCPYDPKDNGFLNTMQQIEYNMMSLIQGAYNVSSAIAMWGGFLGVKQTAFKEVDGFSTSALTEDMDLAFKLNEHGWRVEQSFKPVKSAVPSTLISWFWQKLRWNAGGLQCFVNHVKTWVKNPLHVFMVVSYCLLITGGAVSLIQNINFLDSVIETFDRLNNTVTILTSIQLTILRHSYKLLTDILWGLGFTIFSLPYVFPLINSFRKAHLALLVIPFSMVYIPVFTAVSLVAFAYYLSRAPSLSRGERAW